jgi:hypothetical protein
MAFSMAPMVWRSHGCTVNNRGSGAEIVASALTGVGVPK